MWSLEVSRSKVVKSSIHKAWLYAVGDMGRTVLGVHIKVGNLRTTAAYTNREQAREDRDPRPPARARPTDE